jgi:hypothetical protein
VKNIARTKLEQVFFLENTVYFCELTNFLSFGFIKFFPLLFLVD